MKNKLFILLIVLLLARGLGLIPIISITLATTEPIWVYGDITSIPEQRQYGTQVCMFFNFTVESSNTSWITVYPLVIQAYAPLSVLASSALSMGQDINMTGSFDENNNFVALQIELGKPSWIDSLKALWEAIGTIGRLLVTFIVQLLGLPDWCVTLGVVALITWAFIKFGKKLPLILIIIAFLVAAAMVSYLIGTMQIRL